MNALTVLLLCLTAACAVPVHFPVEKTLIYNYYANVKAEIVEPAQYVSQFALVGQLHVTKDDSDPTLSNAYYVKLNNVKYGMYNGMVTEHYRPIEVLQELGDAAQQIQEPFMIIYNENGMFQGIKMPETESGWSRNIKQGIASMMQLDLAHVQMQTPMKPHGFITHENTIHGVCQVAYDIHPKNPTNAEDANVFVVTKIHDMMNCSHFVQRIFNHVESDKCHMEPMDDMTTSARRVFEIKQQDNDIIIKRMVAHSTISYFPYNGRSEGHYLSTNTTLDLHSVVPTTGVPVMAVNVQNLPIIRDITFNKPLGNYALNAAEDLTHGRHIVKLDALVPKLKNMLVEAADYLEEDHLQAKEPEWKHGQTINRLQHTMTYMDLASLEQVYNAIQDATTPKEITMKNIFLKMIPTVGTTAASHFVRNIVRKHKVTDDIALAMLVKLPIHVKVPSEKLLVEMEDLLKLSNVSPQVKKAGILCFSILIRKTFMHQQSDTVHAVLDRYLHRFLDHIKTEESYEMKMVYLMAMKNVQVGNIEKLLEPIIRGEVLISDNPFHIRVQAIWAIKKAVANKVEYTHNLLWPIFADATQPLNVRIIAYDILMSQMPNMQRIMNIYWLMIHESNNHLYNYHVTTLKSLANSVDPCLVSVREMARKVLRITKLRSENTPLSSKHIVDYMDPMYEHGESLTNSWVLDEVTGMPLAGYVEYHTSVARKPADKVGIYWNAFGLDEIMQIVKKELMGNSLESLSNKNVQNLLIRAAQDMPMKRSIHVDICITLNGVVVLANHYDQNSFKNMFDDTNLFKQMMVANFQEIMYENLYEMLVPTDMGLQGVFSTKIPQLWSIKFNNLRSEIKAPSVNMKFDIDTRIWKHGEYAMSIYNPIVDVWHSVRRATVQDVALPVQMSVGYNHEAKSLKITMPRLPINKLSNTGIRFYAKNLVTITEDEQDVLKTCCATCHHHTVVTANEKKNYHMVMESKDMGLRYSMSIFDCESEMTPMANIEEWHRVLSADYKNTWNSKVLQYIMGVRQKLINDYISLQMGNCGKLMKIEPSIVYPTSHVDMNIRVNMEDLDHIHDKMHALSSNKINLRGTLDVKAASTNESVRSWDVNVNVDMSPGHVINNFKVQITRETPGEKKLKICVDAQKNYPVVETDPLKVATTKEETNSKVTVTAGFTDDDKCVRDDMMIMMTVKGEMSEEQKTKMTHDNMHGACIKDNQNPQFLTRQGHVAKTMNCIRETIQYTTMKKYTINTTYKKVPVRILSLVAMMEDYVRASYLPYVWYITDRAENGNAKVVIEYSTDMSHLYAIVVTPVSGYQYIEVPLQQHLFDGIVTHTPMSYPQWHSVLDNTRFSVAALHKMSQNQAKICTIYPQTLVTLDESVMPFVVFDKWTLISGDHIDRTYAIFVKSVQGTKLAVRVYVADHEMEIVPNEFNAVVSVDGNVIEHYEKGVIVPKDEPKSYVFKLTDSSEHLVVQSQRVPVMMVWTSSSVTLMLDNSLQGRVTGMCGHMDGTHKEKVPQVYTVMNI
ncbi:hypothetical protein PUN28_009999 [Cardiocondyla obscurior]